MKHASGRRPRGKLFPSLKRVADKPEHWGPEANEQGPAFRVAAFVLVDGFGADPQRYAEPDGSEREALHVPGPQPGVVEARSQHRVCSTS